MSTYPLLLSPKISMFLLNRERIGPLKVENLML